MKKILTIAFLLVLTFVSVSVADAKKKGPAKAVFTEVKYDFGSISEDGGPVSHNFEFTNQGESNLMIVDVQSQCGCTVPQYPEKPIAPGKSGVIKVTYSPKGRPGGFVKTVTVITNGSPAKLKLKIKGIVNVKK